MSRILTGDKMITSVRKRTMTPDDTSIFTDQDILDIIDEEIDVEVLEKLTVLHGENLTISVDIPKNTSGAYDIHYRSIGNKLRDVSLVNGAAIFEMSQVSISELSDYTNASDLSSYVDNFYIEHNKVKLLDSARSFTDLRMHFHLRPNTLTKLVKAGIISSITTDTGAGTTTIGLSQVGSAFASGLEYDFIGKRTPNVIKGFDIIPTAVTTGTTGSMVFTTTDVSDFIDDVVVGDYVTIAEETPVPNMPTEMHPLVAQAAAIHILESLTDTEALANAKMRMKKMTSAVQSLIDSRVDFAPKKIKPRHGTLNASIGRNAKGKF